MAASAPDVTIVAVQRADERGNCHLWGNLGITLDAARAARAVIAVTEEIVDRLEFKAFLLNDLGRGRRGPDVV